jgi:hypothetical protein
MAEAWKSEMRWSGKARALGIAAVAVPLAMALPAHAAPDAAAPAPLAESLQGDRLNDYQTARLLLRGHDDVGALIRFTRLYDQVHDPRLLANMALCESELQHPARASELVGRALADGAALFSPEQVVQLRGIQAASLAAAGHVRVTVDVEGAAVVVDDRPVGTSPLPADLLLDRGSHRVRASKAGYTDWTRDVAVPDTTLVAVDVKLAPATRDGAVRVVTAAGNEVAVDGRLVSRGSGVARVEAGTHAVRVTGDGRLPFRTDVSVHESETRTIEVTLQEDRHPPVWLWIVGGTVVGVAIVVAAASVFHTSDAHPSSASVQSPLRVSW